MTEKQYNIYLTDKAKAIIIKQISGHSNNVRLGIKGGGCSGFSYVLEFNDTFLNEKDLEFKFDSISIIVDEKSIKYLNGMTLDWKHSLLDTGFIFNNPNVKSMCGCGTSFEVKDDK